MRWGKNICVTWLVRGWRCMRAPVCMRDADLWSRVTATVTDRRVMTGQLWWMPAGVWLVNPSKATMTGLCMCLCTCVSWALCAGAQMSSVYFCKAWNLPQGSLWNFLFKFMNQANVPFHGQYSKCIHLIIWHFTSSCRKFSFRLSDICQSVWSVRTAQKLVRIQCLA